MKTNIVLIGMAGVGKTAVGKRIAELTKYSFLDVDDIIARKNMMSLSEFLDNYGEECFARSESLSCQSINVQNTIIATGGSVVYHEDGMKHLKESGIVIFLDAPFSEIKERLGDFSKRGIFGLQKKTLEELYQERLPLYQTYADITLDTSGQNIETISQDIITLLRKGRI